MRADIVVIGAGPGGTAAALTATASGRKVVLVESGDVGGTCLNRGCVPTKTWIAASHLLRGAAWGENIGMSASVPDFPKLQAHMRGVVGMVQKGLLSTFKKKGVELLTGSASFTSPETLEINNGETTVEFSRAVIAVGSRPVDIFGREPGFYNSDNIFAIETLPSSIAIIGAGAIGVEMASFFRSMGCAVTLVEAMDDILPAADGEIRAVVKREMKKSGVAIMAGTKIKNAQSQGGECILETEDGSIVKAEAVLTAIGRRPQTGSLGLDKAGVRTDVRGFITVDNTMCGSREGIYAVGDVAGKALLAYTAHHEGIIAARNIMGEPAHMDYRFVPSIIFSSPEIGSVGPTEEQLKQTGKPYRAGRYHVRALARAQAGGEIAGLVKVLVGEDNSILAVHMASPMATELIHSAVMAMAAGMKADKLAEIPFGHPTFSESIPLAVAAALGRSIY